MMDFEFIDRLETHFHNLGPLRIQIEFQNNLSMLTYKIRL